MDMFTLLIIYASGVVLSFPFILFMSQYDGKVLLKDLIKATAFSLMSWLSVAGIVSFLIRILIDKIRLVISLTNWDKEINLKFWRKG